MANNSVIISKANPLESCLGFGKGSRLVYSFQASNTRKVKTTPHSDRSRHASMTWCDPLKSNILSMPKLACLIAITKTNTWRLLIGLEPLIGLLPVGPVPTNSPRWTIGNYRQGAVKLHVLRECDTLVEKIRETETVVEYLHSLYGLTNWAQSYICLITTTYP